MTCQLSTNVNTWVVSGIVMLIHYTWVVSGVKNVNIWLVNGIEMLILELSVE